MNSTWPMVPLAEVLHLQRRWIKLDPTETYREIGIRSFGNGIFHKAPIQGSTLGNKRVLRIEPGDLVFNNVFAWEGAVAVAGPAESGRIGSHRFVTYTVNPAKATAEYLQLYFKTKQGREVLHKASPGSAGRNKTLGLDRFIRDCIPLPPVSEQRGLVDQVDALASKIEEAKALRLAANEAYRAFICSLHTQLADGRTVRMNDILDLHEDRVPVEAGKDYPQVGIKAFGEGMFPRGTVTAEQTTYKAFNRLYKRAVVLSQVKGWEGAIAVCPDELSERFASPEYRTFRSKPDQVLATYLAAVIPTPWFWQQLSGLTRGVGARRERIRPKLFLEMELPMPTIPNQERAVRMFDRVRDAQQEQTTISAEVDAMLPAILDRAFKGQLL
jgi:type I restriction enzyme S subunit